ncbi:hypothetical protein K9M18_00200 [Candidatus Woesearchaeota archaeon]|nr:hypothetical protein [Candidatus Woesearchaeota archaeon]MCF8012947.1 hypothetical protein [Candidatus Woesearchaeota archaeon]
MFLTVAIAISTNALTTDKTIYELGETVIINTNTTNYTLEIQSSNQKYKLINNEDSIIYFTPTIIGTHTITLNNNELLNFEVIQSTQKQPTSQIKPIKEKSISLTSLIKKEDLPISILSIEDSWWNSNYNSRKQINITNNDVTNTITNKYTANITINTQTLITNNKLQANCDDLRIIWINSTTPTEIDRTITNCNQTNSVVEFKIQKNISASSNSDKYYIYYENPSAINPPNNKSNIYYLWEDFEDQTHPFSNGALSPTVTTGSAKNGVYGLEGNGGGGYRRAVVPENLPRGFTIESWVYSHGDGSNADLPGISYGMQTSELNGYQTILDWRSATAGSADMQIRENYASGSPLATSTANTVSKYQWYYVTTTWKENGDIQATIYNSSMSLWGTMNVNDPTYTTGYYGINAYKSGQWDDVKVKLFMSTQPTYDLLTEEQRNPLTVSLNSPENNSVKDILTFNISCTATTEYELINITLYINSTGTWQANQTKSATGNNSQKNFEITLENLNSYKYNCLAIDNESNQAFANENNTFTVNTFFDFTPEINLSYPQENYTNNTQNIINLTLNASVSDDVNLVNCSLYHNYSGTWNLNQTNTVTGNLNTTSFQLNNIGNKSFIWNIGCYDDANQLNFAENNRTIILDNENPQISINEPTNQIYYINNITINITTNEPLNYCNYTLDNWLTNNLTNQISSTEYQATENNLAEGTYTIKTSCEDIHGNINNTEQTIFTINHKKPNVTLTNPTNNYLNNTNQYVNLTFSATATDGNELMNCSLYHNYSGTWILNQTNLVTGISNTTNFQLNNLTNKIFIWNIECSDKNNEKAFATSNRSIILDINPPGLTINSPNETYQDPSPLIIINITDQAETAWYNINNQNNITICNNCTGIQTTYKNLPEGNYQINIYVNDTNANLNSKSEFFTINQNLNYYETYDDQSSQYVLNDSLIQNGQLQFTGTGGETLLNESFDDNNYLDGNPVTWNFVNQGVGDSTPEWLIAGGILSESGNCHDDSTDLGRDTTAKGCYAYPGNYEWTDMNITARIRASDDDGMGLMFRYVDQNNYYRYRFSGTRDFRKLDKFVGGVWSELDVDYLVDGGFTQNNWHIMTITIIGDQIEGYLNGVKVLNATDSSITNGSVALYSWGMDTGSVGGDFDYINVTDLTQGYSSTTFYSEFINTTNTKTLISNITWNENNTDQNNNITIQLTTDQQNWCQATNNQGINTGTCSNFTLNNSLQYKVLFQKNNSGIIGLNDINISWQEDTENPTVEIINPIQNQILTNNYTINISINDSQSGINTAEYIIKYQNQTIAQNWSPLILNQGTINQGYWSSNITTINFQEDTYILIINATDFVGRYNDSKNISFFVDNIGPSLTLLQPTDNQTIELESILTIAVNITDNLQISTNATIEYPNTTTTQINLINTIGNTYEANFTMPIIQGRYNITINTNNSNGRTNQTTTYIQGKDLQNPQVTIINPAPLTTIEQLTNIDINVTINDQTNTTVQANITQPNLHDDQISLTQINSTHYSIEYTNTSQIGIYNITIIATDENNNQNVTETISFQIQDLTKPTAFNLLSPTNATINTTIQPMLQWEQTTEANFKNYTINIYEDQARTILNATYYTTTITNTSITIDALNSDATYYWDVTAHDLYGNNRTSNQIYSYTTDNTNPQINLQSPNNTIIRINTTTINYTPIDTNLKNCTLYLNDTGVFAPNQTTLNPINNQINQFNITLQDNSYDWNINCYDQANQNNFAIQNNTFTINTKPTKINLMSPQNNSIDSDGIITIQYNLSHIENVTNCTLNFQETQYQITSINQNLTNNYQLNNVEAGQYNYNLTCEDLSGYINTSQSKIINVIRTESFSGNTSNMSQESPENLINLILEKPNKGKINFTETINLSGGANLNQLVAINQNFISVDTITEPRLNKSASLTFYNLSYQFTPRILINNQICSECQIINYASNTLIMNVTHFTNYSTEANTQLIIWDQDDDVAGNNHVSIGDQVQFYANYTNKTSGSSIFGAGAYCEIIFDDTNLINMTYNATTKIYEYNRTFDAQSIETWNVSCIASAQNYESLNSTDNVEIRGPAPIIENAFFNETTARADDYILVNATITDSSGNDTVTSVIYSMQYPNGTKQNYSMTQSIDYDKTHSSTNILSEESSSTPQSDRRTIGETGEINLTSMTWQLVELTNTYNNTPVIVAIPTTQNAPASFDDSYMIPTISMVNETHFNITTCLDNGTSTCTPSDVEETIHYFAFDPQASNQFSWIDVGTVSTTTGGADTTVTFGKTFSNTPDIFTTAQTYNQNGNIAAIAWAEDTATKTTSSALIIGCVHQGTSDACATGQPDETMGYIAIDSANINITSWQTGSASISASTWTAAAFSPTYAAPRVMVTQNDDNGAQDPEYAWARSLTGSGMQYRYCEADGADYCDSHTGEVVNWFALEQGNITARGASTDTEANKSYEYYYDVDNKNVVNITNMNITIEISAYSNLGSISKSNNDPDLIIEIASTDNSSWSEIGTLGVSGIGNYTLNITNQSILTAWITQTNRDIRIKPINLDFYDDTNQDYINWSGIYLQMTYDAESSNWYHIFTDTYQLNEYNLTDIYVSDEDLFTNHKLFNDISFSIYTTVLDSFNLTNPTNNTLSADRQPVLNWEQTSAYKFKNYTIQIDNNSDFSSPEQIIIKTVLTENTSTTSNLPADQTSYWRVIAYNEYNNATYSNQIFRYETDNTNPIINLTTPSQNQIFYTNTIIFNYTPNDLHLKNCTLYTDVNGTWFANETNTTPINNQPNYFNKTINDGYYTWNVECYDEVNQKSFSENNNSFIIDTIPPTINLETPQNNTLNETTNNILFEYNVTDILTSIQNCEMILDEDIKDTDISITENTTQNFTIFVANGNHNWSINCTDDNGQVGSSDIYNISVNVASESDPPIIVLNEPLENTYSQLNNITFNYTPSDATGIENCSLIIDGEINQTNTSLTSEETSTFQINEMPDAQYSWKIECYDNNTQAKGNSVTRILTIDTINPIIQLNLPDNDSFYTNLNLFFNYTPTDTNLDYCELFHDDTGIFELKQTNNSPISGIENLFNQTLQENTYLWNIRCVDLSGRASFAIQNKTVKLDANSPKYSNISINPESSTNYTEEQIYEFNITINETFLDTLYIQHNFTGTLTNYSVTTNQGNTYLYNYTDIFPGKYIYKWFMNDSLNRQNETSIFNYQINISEPNMTLTLNGQQNDITINETQSVTIISTLNEPTNKYYELYQNGILINYGTSPLLNITTYNNAGIYQIITNITGSENYTQKSINYTITVNDVDSPIITLIYPEHNSTVGTSNITFQYNVTDSTNITSCELYVDSSLKDTDTNITKNTLQTFNWNVADGDHDYYIRCYDEYSNTGTSSTYDFSVQDSTQINIIINTTKQTYQEGEIIEINSFTGDLFGSPLNTSLELDLIYTNTTTSSASWWNTTWQKRKAIKLNNPDSSASLKTVHVNITNLTGYLTDCYKELRIIKNTSTGPELIEHEIISGDNTTFCQLKFNADLSANAIDEINYHVYYDNNTPVTDPGFTVTDITFNIQRGEITGSTTSITDTMNQVNQANSFIILSSKASSTAPNGNQFTPKFDSDTQISFDRYSAVAGTASWQVIESSDYFVQANTTTLSTSQVATTVNISSINTDKTIIIPYARANDASASNNNRGYVYATILNETQIQLNRSSTGAAASVYYQVIEFPETYTVRSGTLSFTTTSATDTVPQVNTSRSMLFFSYGINGDTGLDANHIRGKFNSGTQIEFNRVVNQGTAYVSWYVVEFPESFVTQSASSTITADTGVLLTNPIVLNKTFHVQSRASSGGGTTYTNAMVKTNLTNTTHIYLDKETTSNINDIDWMLIEKTTSTTSTNTSIGNTEELIQKNVSITGLDGFADLIYWQTINEYFGNYSVVGLASRFAFTNSTNYATFELTNDTTPPIITINYPGSIENISNSSTLFNFTTYDYQLNSTCNITIDGSINQSNIFTENNLNELVTTNNFTEGIHYWNITCWDKYNNSNTTNTRNFTTKLESPDVQLIIPTNNQILTQSLVYFNYTPTDTTLNNCSLYGNFTGDFEINQTNNIPINGLQNSFNLTLQDNIYLWNIKCVDNVSQESYATTNYTFKLDTTAPQINLLNPTNNTLNTTTNNILFEYSTTDTLSEISYCSVILDGEIKDTDITISESATQNFTIFVANGEHNWSINCTDSNGLESSSNKYNLSMNVLFESDPPVIVLNYPLEYYYTNITNITFNYTPSDASDVENCSLLINGEINQTNTSPINLIPNYFELTNIPENNYTWQIQCYDNETFALGYSIQSDFTIDLTNPYINLTSPNDYSFYTSSNVEFNYTPLDTNIENCSLYGNFLGSFELQNTNTTPISNQTNTFTEIINDGTYLWNVKCYDKANRNSFSENNYTVYVDANAPNLLNSQNNPTSPAEYELLRTYYFNITIDEQFKDTVWIEHNFSGTMQNYTVTNNISNTFMYNYTDIAVGNYYYKWYANDSLGRIGNTSTTNYEITKKQGSVGLLLNGLASNVTINESNPLNVTGYTIEPSQGYIILYQDGDMINNGTDYLENITSYSQPGSYNLTVFYNETQNYTASSQTYFVNVVDVSNPTVTLIYPANESYVGSLDINFRYDVTDNVGIDNCKLYVDDILEDTDTSIENNAENQFPYTFSGDGNYSWYVTCTDTSSNSMTTQTNNFTVIETTEMIVNTSITKQIYQKGEIINALTKVTDQFELELENANLTLNLIIGNTTIPWWNESWGRRQKILLEETTGQNQTKETINITIDTQTIILQNLSESNCIDYRFIDSNLNELEYKLISGCNTTQTTFFIKTNLTAGTNNTIYVYYNNSQATNTSNENLKSTIGETGAININSFTGSIKNFNNQYAYQPIILATPVTQNGPTSTDDSYNIPTLFDTGNNYMNISLCQDNGLVTCSNPGATETVHYFVFDVNRTNKYSWIEVGTVNVTTDGIDTVLNFGKTFSNVPTVWTTAQTYNQGGNISSITWVEDTATKTISSAPLIGCVHQGIANVCEPGQPDETIGYIAIDPLNVNISSYQEGNSDISNSEWTTAVFSPVYTNPRVMVTENDDDGGEDPEYPWAKNVVSTGMDFRFCEQDASDVCNSHTSEVVNWFALEDGDILAPLLATNDVTIYQENEEILVLTIQNQTNQTGQWNWDIDTLQFEYYNYSIVSKASYSGYNDNYDYAHFELIPDTTAPNVTLIIPTINYIISNNSLIFNWSANDYQRNQTCNLTIDGTNNQTNIFQNNDEIISRNINNIIEGKHNWSVNCVDVLGNYGPSETRNFTIDLTPPTIQIINPIIEYNTTNTTINFTFNVTDQFAEQTNCSIYFYGINITQNATIQNATNSGINANISYGRYEWLVKCFEPSGNQATSNPRNITILSPPTDIYIKINQNKSTTINWTNIPEAESYNVYITNNFTAGFPLTPNVSGIITNEFTDQTANTTIQRYYKISTQRNTIEASSNEYVGKYESELQTGYNMISSPLTYSDLELENGTNNAYTFNPNNQCIQSLWKYESGTFKRSDWLTDKFVPASGSEDFISINSTEGYWIETNQTCNITYIGKIKEINSTISLNTGPNLVSWYTINEKTLPTNYQTPIINTNPTNSVQAINRFNAITQEFELTIHYVITGTAWGWWPSFNNQEFLSLKPTEGYYFDANQTNIWEHEP